MPLFRHKKAILALLIVIVTFMAFQPMLRHEFLNIDDPVYVTDNVYVKNGLCLEGVQWAFSTLHAEFYHPLTWLSLMLDTDLYGVNPAGYLSSNLILHILNSLLLLAVFVKMTQLPLTSFFVALLFAIHPLHVESVAWIAERKDVLSTFFWMLTLWCYLSYVNKPHRGRYVVVHLTYLLGLMAKPMLVTLPLVLLILDYWPLGRHRRNPSEIGNSVQNIYSLVKEKLFLFVLAAGAAVLAIIAQHKGGGLAVMNELPLGERVSNALVSVLVYIFRTFWPQNLAVFYPFPIQIPLIQVVASLCIIAAITFLCFRFRHKFPYLIAGWLWYVVTLLPVLGVLKVGSFATADRYTYIPLIGLFIMVSWGLWDILKRFPHRHILSASMIGLVAVGLFYNTTLQLQNWADSYSLFSHAVKVTQNNDFAHHSLGHIYAASGDFGQASAHFEQALKINPHRNVTKKDLARVWAYQGSFNKSATILEKLLREKPDYGAAHYTFGLMLTAQKRYQAALVHIAKAFRLHPHYQRETHKSGARSGQLRDVYEQGQQAAAAGNLTKAGYLFERVLVLDAHFYPARIDLADIMVSENCYRCALELFLGKLSDERLKRLLAGGYDKWPVFSKQEE